MNKLIDISNKDYTANPNTDINLNDFEVINIVNHKENIILQKLYSKTGEGSPLMYFRIITPDNYTTTPFVGVTEYEGNILGLDNRDIKSVDDFVDMNDPLLVDLLETAFLPKILHRKGNGTKNKRPVEPLFGFNRYKAIEDNLLPENTINDFYERTIDRHSSLAYTSHLMFGRSRTFSFYNIDKKTGINMKNVDTKVGWGRVAPQIVSLYNENDPAGQYMVHNVLDYLNRQPYRISTARMTDPVKGNVYKLAFPYITNLSMDKAFVYPPTSGGDIVFNDAFFSPSFFNPTQTKQFTSGSNYLYNNIFTFNLLDNDKYLQVFKGLLTSSRISPRTSDKQFMRNMYISARITDDTFNIYNTQININMDVPTHIPYKDHFSRWGLFKVTREGNYRDVKTILGVW